MASSTTGPALRTRRGGLGRRGRRLGASLADFFAKPSISIKHLAGRYGRCNRSARAAMSPCNARSVEQLVGGLVVDLSGGVARSCAVRGRLAAS